MKGRTAIDRIGGAKDLHLKMKRRERVTIAKTANAIIHFIGGLGFLFVISFEVDAVSPNNIYKTFFNFSKLFSAFSLKASNQCDELMKYSIAFDGRISSIRKGIILIPLLTALSISLIT